MRFRKSEKWEAPDAVKEIRTLRFRRPLNLSERTLAWKWKNVMSDVTGHHRTINVWERNARFQRRGYN